jgi:ATP-dependent RNA helicase DeaD
MYLAQEKPKLTIIFTNTRHGARKVAGRLFDAGLECKEIHGDLVQQKREKIMDRFRKHQIPILVATDLASRGIDVHEITHIINYDLPQDISVYVHRIGRTARMGAKGKAVTFVTREEGHELTKIEQMINKELHKLDVEGFTSSQPTRESSFGPSRGGPPQNTNQPMSAPVAQPVPVAAAPASTNLSGKFPLSRRSRRR